MSDFKYKIHIFGPSGSGKGTQRTLLEKRLGVLSVSMGDLLRSVASEESERGQSIKERLEQGLHVENAITNKLIFEWIKKHGQNGFIIEGYPRNRIQFDFFEKVNSFTHALFLVVSDQEVVTRVSGRRVCQCGRTYHLKYHPPSNNETCDACGSKLQTRSDSSPRATEQRIKLYHQEMVPLIDEYRLQGVLHEINGEQPIEKVHQDILKAINFQSDKPTASN